MIIPVLAFSGMVIALWGLYCNNLTCKQLMKIIDVLGKHPDGSLREDFENRYRLFGSVSYNEHLWRLMTFRDPYVIYPESIIADLGKVSA